MLLGSRLKGKRWLAQWEASCSHSRYGLCHVWGGLGPLLLSTPMAARRCSRTLTARFPRWPQNRGLVLSATYAVQGLQSEYKSVDAYYKHVSQKANQQEHKAFLQGRRQWVQQHNDSGLDKRRLQSKKAPLEAKKRVDVVHATGGRFKVPKQFVEVAAWDEDVRGPMDKEKVVKEQIYGPQVEGVWVDKEKKGVFDFEMYDDTKMEETEEVAASADTPFGEEAIGRAVKGTQTAPWKFGRRPSALQLVKDLSERSARRLPGAQGLRRLPLQRLSSSTTEPLPSRDVHPGQTDLP